VRSTTKSIICVITLSFLGIILILTGAQAAQSKTTTAVSGSKANSTFTPDALVILTATLTATPTATLTPTATATATPPPAPIEIIVEDPVIYPPYGELCASYWYSYTNVRGHYAYLTLNVEDQYLSTNGGVWRPQITSPGFYRIEAFIPAHPAVPWECPPGTIEHDTSDARYIIQHANGQVLITGTQNLYSNDWLPLGEYLFRPGSGAYVTLTDLNSEVNFTSTVSFSAMRFTWLRDAPELFFLPLVNKEPPEEVTGTVSIQNAPAFDQCHLATVEQMQNWWNNSPYRITNVYIGGGLLYHECTVPDANWINSVRSQGWGMIPTWVGPQAPCSIYRLRMSSDPDEAYLQGQAEADAAALTASQIGLTSSGLGGTIIYYDMEGFSPANDECREAVKSFLSGWTQRLRVLNNRSGAYGGTCTSYIRDWAAINPPDNIWAAAWYQDPDDIPEDPMDVPLFGLTCLPDDLWTEHQRIRQYRASHNETWGHVSFNIDSNIADAEVATPLNPAAGFLPEILITNDTSEITDLYLSNSNGVGLLVENGKLYASPQGNSIFWQPRSYLPTELAMRKLFFLDENTGWSIASSDQESYSLFSTADGGASWINISTLPINAGWEPASLQFTTPHSGWLAVMKNTRSNFSVGSLLHTTDGGLHWQVSELPFGGEVRFSTEVNGWISGGVDGNEFYQTLDGGRSWYPVSLSIPPGDISRISSPSFGDPQNGILPITVQTQVGIELYIFTTYNGGETWQPSGKTADLPEGLLDVHFVTPEFGWGTTNSGTCQTTSLIKACTLQSMLWASIDAGKTWEAVNTP
jgi:photosystem II stability/assembly factor-like uncharacterized protein